MDVGDMGVKILSSSFENISVSKTDVAFTVAIIVYFFLHIPLFCKPITNDCCNHVGEHDFEETPVNQVRNKSAVVIFLFIAHAFSYYLLRIQRTNACHYRIAVFVYVINVDVDLFVVIQRPYVIVQSDKSKDERESESQQTDESKLFPSQPDCLEDTFQELKPGEYEKERKRVSSHFKETSVERND